MSSLSGIRSSLPLIQAAGRNVMKTDPLKGALAAMVLGSAGWAIYSTYRQRENAARIDIADILPPTIMGTLLSYSPPDEIRRIAHILAPPHNETQVISQAFKTQVESHNYPNKPMTPRELFLLSFHVEGPLLNVLQLDFNGAQILDGELEIIKRCHNLQFLNLSNTPITDERLFLLKELPLESLDLNYCNNITGTGLQQFTRLKHLNLSNCAQITGDSLPYLAGLPLQSLDLSRCVMPRVRFEHLSRLQQIKLRDCELTNESLFYLSKSQSLEWIDILGNPEVDENGFQHLTRLPMLKQLLCRSFAQNRAHPAITSLIERGINFFHSRSNGPSL